MRGVTDKFIRRARGRMVRTVKGINGPGVSVAWGQGVSIGRPQERWSGSAPTPQPPAVRVIVTTAPTTSSPRVALVKEWNGVAAGGEFAVELVVGHGDGDVFYAFKPKGGTSRVQPARSRAGLPRRLARARRQKACPGTARLSRAGAARPRYVGRTTSRSARPR